MQISRDFRPTKYVTKYRKTRQTKYQALLRLGVGNGKFERAKGLSSTFLLLFFPTLSTQEKPETQTKKTSSTRRLSLQETALHRRPPTLSYFALSSPEENK